MHNSSPCKSRNENYIKNRDAILERVKKRYWIKKPIIQEYKKKYRLENGEFIARQQKTTREENLRSWEGYIPEKMNCEICGRELFFNKKNRMKAVHFDHKNENCKINMIPITWLRSHHFNDENKALWESCDFGKLCIKCNSYLPTKNRVEFVKQVVRYVFGRDMET